MVQHATNAGVRSGAFRLSLVVPMYDEDQVAALFIERVLPILSRITPDFEILCVNDGSRDGTIEVLRAIHLREPRVKIIDLSRNFGKEVALTAGLDHATGDAVVPIDADLQDPPELIEEMVRGWQNGADVVLAIRRDRSSDSRFKRVTAHLFYQFMRRIGEIQIPSNAGDFRLMDRRVVDSLKRLPERTRFMKGLFAWLGFRTMEVYYDRPVRAAGETKWRFWRLWNFALEGIFSFSTVPLRIWSYIGLAVSLFAAAYLMWVVLKTLIMGVDTPGYASLLSVVLLFSGLNMLGLGIIGEYLGRVFMETKQRPLYLVQELVGVAGFPDAASESPGRRSDAQPWIQPGGRSTLS
jgi:polyisoprenyl-phosphate glycosyltransferase